MNFIIHVALFKSEESEMFESEMFDQESRPGM